MSSEHLTYLREVLEHDAIGFGEYDQLPAAIEHFEALEHASGQYRKAMSEQAKRIEQLEAALRRVRKAICEAPPDIVTDTLWMHDRRGETVVDCIDSALNDDDWEVRDRAALAGEKKDG